LGTNLLLQDLVDVDTLAEALSRHVGAPAAKQKHFEQVDEEALRLIPAQIAAKHRAVPLALVQRPGREIFVALRDPHDVAAIDEIAFVAGARVRPFVAPELCLLRFIDFHYGVRFELDHIHPRRTSADADGFGGSAPSPARPEMLELDGRHDGKPRSSKARPPRAPTLADLERAASWLPSLPTVSQVCEPNSPLEEPEVLPSMVNQLVEDPAKRSSPPRSPASSTRPALALDAALARFEETVDRETIGTIIIDFLRATYGCGLLFIVKNEIARGWAGFGPGVAPADVEALSVPLDPSSLLGAAFTRYALAQGPPEDTAKMTTSPIYAMLGCEPPREAIASPILVKGRVVNLIYAHAPDRGMLPEFAPHELKRICEAASESFVRAIQVRKKNGLRRQP
jgi:hypothetical protein